jgi:hypothetical protein
MEAVASRRKNRLAADDTAVQDRVIAHDLEESDLEVANQPAGLAAVIEKSQEILEEGEKGLVVLTFRGEGVHQFHQV